MLKTILTFDNIVDAHLALGKLQSEGLEAFLQDEHLVQTDWLYNIAVGGIKLQVDEHDIKRAQDILARDDSERIDVDNLDDYGLSD